MFKKLVSLLLILCMVLPLSPVFATAPDDESICLISGIDAYGGFGENSIAVFSDTDFSAFKSRLLSGLKNLETKIYVNDLGYTVDDFYGLCEAVNEVVGDNPELFYVIDFDVWGNQTTNAITSFTFKFSLYGEQLTERIEKFNAEVDKILSLVSEDMTDFEKMLVLHDHLALRAEYNESATSLSETPSSFRADGVILDRLGVCQSYTYAYRLLLKRLGINSSYATSNEMNHIWNIAELDNKWYHIDITWDDPVTDHLGYVRHNYFLISDSAISSESGRHYDWVSDYACDDVSLDDAYFRDILGQIIIDTDNAYYILDKSICSHNLTDGTVSSIYTVNDRWRVWDSENLAYIDSFSRLVLKDGRLYFNTPDKIQSILPDGTDIMTFLTYTEGDGYIYGICEIDNKMEYGISTSPNIKYTVLTIPMDNIILGTFSEDGIFARFLGEIPQGTDIITAFYSSDGSFISAKTQSADETLTAPLNQDDFAFVRLMWWNISSLAPISYDLRLIK